MVQSIITEKSIKVSKRYYFTHLGFSRKRIIFAAIGILMGTTYVKKTSY